MVQATSSESYDRRARQVCVFGLIAQLFACLGIFGASMWAGSGAVAAEAVHLAGGVFVWLVLLVVFVQRRRAGAEKFETDELRRMAEAGANTTIFEAGDEAMHLERQRLRWIQKWFLPFGGLALASFHVLVYVLWHMKFGGKAVTDSDWLVAPADQKTLTAIMVALAGIFCFLFSRYASGMARSSHWRTLRAAATYLAGNALMCLVLVAALLASGAGMRLEWAEPLAIYIIKITMLVLGIEFLINWVLDIYRPRMEGEELRPAFDSRLLALISEPGGVAKSIADAFNYQFGFEVSGTWLYQLLRRSVLPLLVFTMLSLVGLSSVLIVDIDQQLVVERFGKPPEARTLGPGLHFKLPWPIDRAYRQSVTGIRTLVVGTLPNEEKEDEGAHDRGDIELWTEKHNFASHMSILVAHRPERMGDAVASKSFGVAMVKGAVAIQYVLSDIRQYMYKYEDPSEVLEAVAFQTLTEYAAGVELNDLIGAGRAEFEAGLRDELQIRIDRLELGIDIIFLGLQAAHPPEEEGVAASFQNVVAAVSRKKAAIEESLSQAQQIKTQAAGSVERADDLDAAIQAVDTLSVDSEADPAALAAAKAKVDELMLGDAAKGIPPMGGMGATGIFMAEASKTAAVAKAKSKRTRFEGDLLTFKAAPVLYKMRKYLDMWVGVAQNHRKVVVLADLDKTDLIIILETEQKNVLDLTEPGSSGN